MGEKDRQRGKYRRGENHPGRRCGEVAARTGLILNRGEILLLMDLKASSKNRIPH